MKRRSNRFLLMTAILASANLLAGAAPPVRPGALWLDDRGQEIQAHGGGIVLWRGTYYWFGEDRTQSNDPEKRYVACYSSTDLVHWKFRRQVLALADPEHLGLEWRLERPKVFPNSRTGKFVKYAHLDDNNFKVAKVAVAVSDSIDGDYRYLSSFRPLGEESRDIGQFTDEDGSAYLIFESRPTGGFFIAKLSDDYLSVEKKISFCMPRLKGALWFCFKGSTMLWAPIFRGGAQTRMYHRLTVSAIGHRRQRQIYSGCRRCLSALGRWTHSFCAGFAWQNCIADMHGLNGPSIPRPAGGEGCAAKPDGCSAAVISRSN